MTTRQPEPNLKRCARCGQPHTRCAGHVKNGPRKGQPCMRHPKRGATVCRQCGGNAPQVIAAAERRVELEEAAKAVVTYGLPIDISPTEALLEEVRWTAGHVAWLRQRVQETEQQQLTVGVAGQRIDPGGGKTVKIKTAPNVWLDLYAAERRHLVDVCAAALRAGIEERQIRLAERHGQLMEVFIRGVLADLRLTPAQEALVPTVVPARLRELIAGGGT
jgi:hypothetical protein